MKIVQYVAFGGPFLKNPGTATNFPASLNINNAFSSVNKNVHGIKLNSDETNSALSTGSTEMLATALKTFEEKELSACPVTDTQPKAPLFLVS